MKAITMSTYGGPEVLEYTQVTKTEPGTGELCIRIHASSINFADNAMITGKPFPVRAASGLFNPKNRIPGSDVAGIVEAVGEGVTSFSVGDRVFGDLSDDGGGAYAQYVCARAELFVEVPEDVSMMEAGVTPLAGVTAYQGLVYHGKIKSGDKVLINGASGGVGSWAVQIAKALGAEVTVVAGGAKCEAIKACNPDHIIDYKREDVTESGKVYDLIYDNASYRNPRDYEKILADDGIYICNGGLMRNIFKVSLLGRVMSGKRGIKYTGYLAKSNADDLKKLAELMGTGKIKPLVDSIYNLEDTAEGLQRFQDRKHCGKIGIKA